MVIEAEREGCVREVLVIASALSIQDVRERPKDKPEKANELHKRFDVEGSDLLSIVALAGYLALFVVAARAAGSHATLRELLPLLVLGLLAMALPLNVGGWGPREGVTAVAFGTVGFGAAQGLTTAIVYGVLSLIACLPGAVVIVLSVTRAGARRRSAAPARSSSRARAETSRWIFEGK